jgi:DNA repair protein SbcC/Rad50
MLIEKLSIRAFRGIGPIELDLSRRISVIYAPNGTGKTSLCDSVEWLLTGEVARLRDALGRTDGLEFRNVFKPHEEPHAECTLRVKDNDLRIRRTGSAKPTLEVREGAGSWRLSSLDEVLSTITPDSLPAASKGVQNVTLRRNWVRAARFLEPETLSVLVDTSKAHEERDLIFSELLGVGELQKQERDLNRIKSRLKSDAQLSRDLHSAEQEKQLLESEVKASIPASEASQLAYVSNVIAAIREELGLSGPLDTVEREFVHLEHYCATSEQNALHTRELLSLLATEAHTWDSAKLQLSALEANHLTLSSRLSLLQETVARLSKEAEDIQSEFSRASAAVKRLDQAPLAILEAQLMVTLESWKQAGGMLAEYPDSAQLAESLRLVNERRRAAEETLSKAKRAQLSLASWQAAQFRANESRRRLDENLTDNPAREHNLAISAQALRDSITELETKISALASPLQRLRSIGHEFVEASQNEHACPLCRHDFGSHEALRRAISDAVSMLPVALSDLHVRKERHAKELAAQESELTNITATRRKADLLKAQISELNGELELAAQILSGLGVDPKELESAQMGSVLENVLAQAEAAVADAVALERRHDQLNQSFSSLQEFEDLFAAIAVEMASIGFSGHDKLAGVALDEWPTKLALLRSFVNGEIRTTQAKLAQTSDLMSDRRNRLESSRQELAALSAAHTESAATLSSLKARYESFLSRWKYVGGAGEWSMEKADQLKSLLDRKLVAAQSAKRNLQVARTAHLQVLEAERGQKQIELKNARLNRVIQTRKDITQQLTLRNQLDSGIKALARVREYLVAGQIQPLSRAISALYTRVQSNAFIDRIEASVADGALRWLARIGAVELHDTAEMSLGQRQDLAVAIFLARAREMGGSFILDEPLLHLDDLNRIGLLDVLRTLAVERTAAETRLIITTANMSLIRHLREKFSLVRDDSGRECISLFQLVGDPRASVVAKTLH